MKTSIHIAFCAVLISLFFPAPCSAQTASSVSAGRCKQPIVLEVLPSPTGAVFKLQGKTTVAYPLTEMANELNGCSVERPIHVVVDSRLPVRYLLGGVPSKLEAKSVRYFVRTSLSVVEIAIISDDAKIPTAQ
jgi:hypothetical protein